MKKVENSQEAKTDIAIIGAGPYGLSMATHVKHLGLDFRIFGSLMHTWLNHMPEGMRLKSEGFASSLYDPNGEFTLRQYCKQESLPYDDLGLPVPLGTFSSYGLEFQKKFVPELEDKQVVSLRRSAAGFHVGLGNGEVVVARRVVASVGLTHYVYVPPMLAALPEQFATHSSQHRTLDKFKGREVAVVGAGASALDVSALLLEQGTSVQLVARKPVVRFHDQGEARRPLMERIRFPMTGIGPGWRSLFCTDAPLLFRLLPEQLRIEFVRRHLGPAPGWFIKDQVVGKMPFNLGVTINQAKVQDGRVSLDLTDGAGARRTLTADHMIAATGYRVDLERLKFLDAEILKSIRSVEKTPILSSNFESSVPGLYFVGVSAANSFGPLQRFAFGAGFAARRVSRHLASMAPQTGDSQPRKSPSYQMRDNSWSTNNSIQKTGRV